jgi:hypothetical protein
MNPAEHPIRVLLVLTIVVSLGVGALAWGAMHTVEGFYHGLRGPGCPPNLQNCIFLSEVTDHDGTGPNAQAHAGNYHWTGSGWNTQCYSGVQQNVWGAWCDGPSGNLPCQKYAHMSANDPQSHLLWHGHNPATIGCA